jgi:pimeloyl-ACP methyl ester carboxylesterase
MRQKSVYKTEEGKRAILGVYDMIVQNWPVPYETIEVDTRHGRTFVIACGDSALPPLFLIHGSGSNAAMWIGDAAEYSKYYRVYALDIPGEPGKSCDIRPDLRTQAHAEWLWDVFAALNVDRAFIVGLSLGGWVALRFASAYPEKVVKLALLCPAGIGPQRFSLVFSLLAAKLRGKRGADKAMRKVSGGAEIPEEVLAYSRLITENFNYYRGVVPRFTNAELARLIMPTLLVVGQKDTMLNAPKTAARARKQMPTAETVLLPGAGHMLIDQRERVMRFLQ